MAKQKDPAAVELGRRGGRAKVQKGFAVLTEEERSKAGAAGAAARWDKKRKKTPK